jgi:integrase
MASLRRKPNSKFWIACFTDHHGDQRQRSTKETRRDVAQKIADRFETAYAQRLTEAQVRKVIADIYEDVRGEVLFHDTTRNYLTKWVQSREKEVSVGSHKRYTQIIEDFIDFLGSQADEDFSYVTKGHLIGFRDSIAERSTSSNAHTCIKILRIPFALAVNDGIRPDNPARSVVKVKKPFDPHATGRREFSREELAKVLKVADLEWQGMILCGAYTGQRLGDIASWIWRKIDLKEKVVHMTMARKTDRNIEIPLAKDLMGHLQGLPSSAPNEPIFPRAFGIQAKCKGESRQLSNEFYHILVKAELASPRTKKNTGKGHGGKRTVNELSFHSLRHTATTWLKEANVPEAVVRDIIGHESTIVSQRYTHVSMEAKRSAINKLSARIRRPGRR